MVTREKYTRTLKAAKCAMSSFAFVLLIAAGCKAQSKSEAKPARPFAENVEVTTEYDEESKTTYHLTRIKHKDKEGKLIKLRMALASKPDGETATQFASRMKTAVTFNASMGLKNPPPGTRQCVGIQIIDGKIVQELSTNAYTLGIKENNELVRTLDTASANALLTAQSALSPSLPENVLISK